METGKSREQSSFSFSSGQSLVPEKSIDVVIELSTEYISEAPPLSEPTEIKKESKSIVHYFYNSDLFV